MVMFHMCFQVIRDEGLATLRNRLIRFALSPFYLIGAVPVSWGISRTPSPISRVAPGPM